MQNYKDIDKFITKALKIYGNISMILLFALKKCLHHILIIISIPVLKLCTQ